MEIRKAVASDLKKIVNGVRVKGLDYITPMHVREDILKDRQFVLVDNGKIIAILSLVEDHTFHYYAMKRLLILNKKNYGKGYAQALLQYVSTQAPGKVGCTPWVNNGAMRHMLEKLGFSLEYIFEEKWCFYSKK